MNFIKKSLIFSISLLMTGHIGCASSSQENSICSDSQGLDLATLELPVLGRELSALSDHGFAVDCSDDSENMQEEAKDAAPVLFKELAFSELNFLPHDGAGRLMAGVYISGKENIDTQILPKIIYSRQSPTKLLSEKNFEMHVCLNHDLKSGFLCLANLFKVKGRTQDALLHDGPEGDILLIAAVKLARPFYVEKIIEMACVESVDQNFLGRMLSMRDSTGKTARDHLEILEQEQQQNPHSRNWRRIKDLFKIREIFDRAVLIDQVFAFKVKIQNFR